MFYIKEVDLIGWSMCLKFNKNNYKAITKRKLPNKW